MKKTMKYIALVLAAVMCVCMFASCDNGGKEDPTAAPTEAGENVTAEAGTDANVEYTGTFKIGGSGPLTGGAAVYGLAVKYGAEIAVEEINANGGINGMKVELNFQDDEHDAEKAVNAYNALKDWGMQAMLGTVTTGPCLSVIAETAADNMFQLTPSASAESVIVNDNCFQVCFTDPNQGSASATYISGNSIASKVAVIYNSSDAYSSGIYATFKTKAEELGLEIVAAEAFTDDAKTDFSTQLAAAKSAGAELVFLPIYAQEASLILAQAASAEFKPIFFGCDGLDGILGIEGFDTTLAEGTMLLTPFAADAQDERTQSFVERFTATYGEIPNQFAADAYDGIFIIKAAAEKAGVTSDMSVSDIGDALKGVMTDISVDGLTGEAMKWTADGAVNKAPKAVKIVGGAYVSMD